MLSKLRSFCKEQNLISRGDRVVCAVSGGADSMALLWALYLLKDEWDLELAAVHFNHHLRGEESDRDEAFVRDFCQGYGIPLSVGHAHVAAGEKGLEAAARDARYAYFGTLSGKIATAHTADDNAETVLMHLVRGTGLRGLGGITPKRGNLIRPMLSVTRCDVEAFLVEYAVAHITDSSNETDAFLRNRLRHHVMPLLKEENPKLAENLSAMALRLRQDEAVLSHFAAAAPRDISFLRTLFPAARNRVLKQILTESGVKEPEAVHIRLLEALVFSENPSARANFPNGVTIGRNYNTLEVITQAESSQLQFTCSPATEIVNTSDTFTVVPVGQIFLRPRQAGDTIRLYGGTKSIKKLFIDRKIPAAKREHIPILCDDAGIIGIPGISVNLDRAANELPATKIQFHL